MEVTLRLASEPATRKRVAVLVSKEPHCLEQLIRDRDAGLLRTASSSVLSNHPDLEPIAQRSRHPVRLAPSTDKAAHEDFLLERLAEVKPDLVVLARYMQILTPALIDRYPAPHHQHPPVAAAVPPGRERLQAGVRGGRARVGLHGPLRHRAARRGPGDPAGRLPHPRRRGHARRGEGRAARSSRARVLSQAVQLFLNEQLVVKDSKVIFRPGRFPGTAEGA